MNYICVEDCNPDTSNAITTTVNGPNEEKQKSDTNHSIPLYYSLNQNFPNPFNPSTKIRYSIKDVVFVNLVIYDILGRRIETLVNEEKSPGEYEINFSGHNLASGVYLYKLTAGTFTQIKKMQILK